MYQTDVALKSGKVLNFRKLSRSIRHIIDVTNAISLLLVVLLTLWAI